MHYIKFQNIVTSTKIKGKFDGKTVIITIPMIPGKVPKKETQPTEKEPSQEAEWNPEEEKEGTPPSDDNQESKEEADHATSTSNPPNIWTFRVIFSKRLWLLAKSYMQIYLE